MDEKRKKLLIIIILHAGFILPFVARIPGGFIYGYDFFAQYFLQWSLAIMISILNFAPFCILAVMISLMDESKNNGLLGAGITAFTLDLYFHGTLDIVGDTNAGTAILLVPFFVTIFMAIGFILGLAAGKAVNAIKG